MWVVHTSKAPEPGAYSQGVGVGSRENLVFLSGQTGNDPVSGEVVAGGVGPQTTQVLENLLAVVEKAGGHAGTIASLDVFIRYSEDPGGDRLQFAEAYEAFFKKFGMSREAGNMPARMQVWVSEIPWESEDTRIEIRGIAVVP